MIFALHQDPNPNFIETQGSLKNWNAIAAKLPGRTNKDCRKRWHKIEPNIRKGAWTAAEHTRLQEAVDLFGLRQVNDRSWILNFPTECPESIQTTSNVKKLYNLTVLPRYLLLTWVNLGRWTQVAEVVGSRNADRT